MRDERRAPFVWQSVTALEALRGAYSGSQRSTAIGLYTVMTEVANEQRQREGTFSATRRDVAQRAGMSRDTLDRYVKGFEDARVLEVDRRPADDGGSLPNRWTLVEPTPAPCERCGQPFGAGGHGPGFCIDRREEGAAPMRQGGRTDAAGGGRTHAAVVNDQEQPPQEEGDADVAAVWKFWLDARKPKVTKLSPGTARQIKRALNAGFEVDDLTRAIDGLLASDWHREKGKLQLSTVFTTGPGTQSFEDRIQSFIDKAPGSSHQPRTGRKVPPPLRSALIAARDHPRARWENGRWITGDSVIDARYAHAITDALDRFDLRVVWAGENFNKLRFEEEVK